jgi:tripartite-type tricarboxylate transporter receptor subunit TctC
MAGTSHNFGVRIVHRAAVILSVAIVGIASPTSAQTNADSYEGATITMVIGYGPGAAYDTYARLLIRHLGRHIPGQPSIVPKNMPGAGSMIAANHLFNAAPKDGTVIGSLATSAVLGPLFGLAAARFNPTEFNWIGNLDQSIGTCATWHTSGIRSFDDLFTREALFGGSGTGAVNSQHATALKNLLGLKIRVIQGFRGSADVKLAMQRGEVQANCGLSLGTLKAQHLDDFRSGKLKPIIQLAFEKHPELSGVSHIYDYAKSLEMRQTFDLIFGAQVIGRPFAAPPGIPPARTAILRRAFTATVKDPQFQQDVAKLNLPVTTMSGEEVQQLFSKFMAYPADVVKKATNAYNP